MPSLVTLATKQSRPPLKVRSGPRSDGEGGLCRIGVAGQVGVSSAVDSHADAAVVASTADVARVREAHPVGPDLRYERVRTAVVALVRPGNGAEAVAARECVLVGSRSVPLR